ncbi:uncharacterized protein F5891DRAFT_481421 [Suillus fuscotomentosus]|uniref:F-box domain-containing protein n=1 Tax=Suillus fuscotomentosus TaxID=1912939 RepID=A0AAD4E2T9_9AGAM|nr:uncharacterized protein F5891DRAFT_481421 [Suillus fuscotomentosus]KAG1898307.1 hypothetical protein F5891DRAFT_481421 [Suillus fuscotomentosus]
MGTNGHYVVRYRNMYYLSHHGSDGYPEGLGLKVLQYIRQPNAIATYQKVFGEMLDGLKSPSHSLLLIEGGDENFDGPSQLRPETCGWTYEIDLDRNIFHVCDMPFFSLECLPDDAVFLQYISDDGITRDHYGHAACPLECPPENRYKKPTPPIVHNSELETYQSLMCTGSQVALSDLLAVSDGLSQDEHVRVTLLEVMIGQCMFSSAIGKEIYEIELLNDHNQITDDQWSIACFMASITFIPQMFDDVQCISHPKLKRKEFTWVREDTVVYIATHLYDERCLQASVSRLINVILEQTNHSGHYFGIAFSVFHCAVVKVVKNAHTMSFSHTSALQFLPSFYADSPSTPGITGLARLGYRIDPALFRRALEACHYVRYIYLKESPVQRADRSDDMPPTTICPTLPLELWREIACYLTHPFHLIVLGLVSRLCRQAVLMVLRCTHLCGYRLVSAPQERPEYRMENLSLRAASFSAVRNDILTTVNVGVEFRAIPSKSMITPLRIKNSSFYIAFSAGP